MPKSKYISHKNLLKILIEINKWEKEQLLHFKSGVARDIYFSVAEDLLHTDYSTRSIKQQISQTKHTDRAARINVRKLEESGVLKYEKIEKDARLKKIIPTDVYLKKLNDHLKELQNICAKYFVMIEK